MSSRSILRPTSERRQARLTSGTRAGATLLAVVLAAAASVTAATASSPAPVDTTPTATTATTAGGMRVLRVGHRDLSPDVPAADLQALVAGNTAFATDLYQQVIKTQQGNLVYSPLSISVAFGMQDIGARDSTAGEIGHVMHFTLPTQRLDAAMDELALELASRQNPRLTLSVVDRLFGQQDYAFKKSFLKEVTSYYGAPMAAMDFKHAPEPARRLINQWVADQTDQLIKDLIQKADPPLITPRTKLVLVNAIHLDAKWAVPFDPDNTERKGWFQLAGGTYVRTPMMGRGVHNEGPGISQPWAITPDYQAIDLPYKGNQLSMLIVMPTDMAAFQESLDPDALAAVVDSLRKGKAELGMPRFSIRTDLLLAPALKVMGMQTPFGTDADFSGMSDYPRDDLKHRLHISAVIHQAFIKVGEKGTEAAAATAIIDDGGGGPGPGDPLPRITIDHPFMWFIRDRLTGTILFMGRVTDPSQSAR